MKDRCYLFLKSFVTFCCDIIQSRVFLWQELFNTASISPAFNTVFRLSTSSFSFGRLYLLEICLFRPGCNVSWHTVFWIISYNPLYFCGISCNLSSVISDCVYLDLLSFFLDKTAWQLVNFIYLFQEPSPGFVDPWKCSFSLYVIKFCCDLGYSLPCTCSGLSLLLFLQFL